MPDVARAIEQRRGVVERNRSVQGAVYSIAGFIKCNGAGEGLYETNFPMMFQERPAMSFGAELADNSTLEDGNFPWVNVMVKSWKKIKKDGQTFYTGCTLIIVASGHETMSYTAHWQATGRALTNPLNHTTTVDDTI